VPPASSGGPTTRGKRLDAAKVRAIAERIAAGERHTAIAGDFGVSVETVGAIKSGKRWAEAIDDDLRARMQAASAGAALDADGARRVMAALVAGRSGRSIAEEYGISPSLVSAIKHGRAWAELDPGLPERVAGKPRQGKTLTATQAAEIKTRLLAGRSSRQIAAEFGVSASTIQAISQGRTWAETAPLPADVSRLRALLGIKWRRYDPDVIPAWVADMDFPTAPAITRALREMVDASDFGYNLASFDDSIPKAWAQWSARRFGWEPQAERIKVFSTSLQAIAAALWVGTSAGDGVVLFTPVYPPFFSMINGSGRRVVEYRLDEAGWRIDVDRLSSVVDSGTRALILCNPHNPSGRSFGAAELDAIATVAEKHDLLVISDEIWQDIVYRGSGGPGSAGHIPFASISAAMCARSITVTAASKSFSLGGLSCAVAHLGHAKVAEQVSQLPPFLLGGVNALGARATLEAWTHGEAWLSETVATLHANRDRLLARMRAELPEVPVETPEATYLAWLDFRATPIAEDPAAALLECGRVALSPGPDFGAAAGAGFARLNFATPREVLHVVIDRIVATVRAKS